MFQENPIQKLAAIALLAWFILGLVIVTTLEMKLRGLKLRDLGKAESGKHTVFFRTTNSMMVWAMVWPMAVAIGRLELKYRKEESQLTG